MKHYNVFTAKNGNKYIQTKSKYLAHALCFCGYKFMVFKENDGETEIYSFQYSEELIQAFEHIIKVRNNNALY